MTSVETVFFDLIKSVIFEEKVNISAKEIPEESLREVLLLAKKHDLAHLMGVALAKHGITVNEKISGKLAKEQILAFSRYERLNYDYEVLRETLEKNGIDFIPLKGLIIRGLYPEPWMRTSCDIDVLVKKEDVETAINLLCEQGFTKGEDYTTHDHILKSQSGMTLELHYSLLQDGALPKSDEILEAVWQNVSEEQSEGNEKHITNEFFVFYHIVHMAKHFVGGGCGVRPFIDLLLIKEKMPCNEANLGELLQKSGLAEFYDGVLGLINVWFEGGEHTSLTLDMESFVLTGGVYGNFDNSAKVQAAKGETKSKTFWNLMFLPRANLEIIYPKLKKRPWLLPFYQVKRWFRIFKKDNRKRATTIMKARSSVGGEEASSTEKLLDRVGLK